MGSLSRVARETLPGARDTGTFCRPVRGARVDPGYGDGPARITRRTIMTVYIEQRERSATWPLFAALGIGVALILTAMGTFWDLTDNESGTEYGVTEYAITSGIILVAAALVFGLVVRTATQRSAPRRAVILAVLGLLSVLFFWTGLPMVFAAGALATVQRSASTSTSTWVVVALATITTGLAIFAAIAG
jgi:hypothetical protein